MRRRLLTIAIFLLAGAVVNVAVAWGCAAWHYVAEATRTPGMTLLEDGSTIWRVASYRSRLAHRIHSVWQSGFGQETLRRMMKRQQARASPGEIVRGWTHILAPDAANGGEASGACVFDGRGWPTISMWSALELEFVMQQIPGLGPPPRAWKTASSRVFFPFMPSPQKMTRGIELAPYSQFRSGAPQHQYRVLPLGIIWPGFAVNTLFYAAILWLVIPGPFALRRLIRKRRGLCPKCAYPMGELAVCTECGRELPQRVRVAS